MRLLRTAVLGVLLAVLVVAGVLGRVAVFALAWERNGQSGPSSGEAALPFSAPGPYPVGLRELEIAGGNASLHGALWYPARISAERQPFVSYPYGMKLFGGEGSVALAAYHGTAARDAEADLTGGPYPLAVLSPGFAISMTTYGWLAEHLASYGLVVLGVEHDEELDPSQLWRATVERPRDVTAALTYVDAEVSGARLSGLVDPSRVAVIGHSYGGYTALVAAGARLDSTRLVEICDGAREAEEPVVFLCDSLEPNIDAMAAAAGLDAAPDGLWPSWDEPVVDAAIALAGDAVMFGEGGVAEIDIPVLAIGGTEDVDSPYVWGTQMTYREASSQRKVEIGLQGAEHMIFTGPCEISRWLLTIVSEPFCADPAWDKASAHDVVRHYAAAFLLAELTGDSEAAGALALEPQPYPRVDYVATGY